MKKHKSTKVSFGWDDGDVRTVMLMIGTHDAGVTLRGHDLDMVTAAFFHLRGYEVSPGLKKFGLRKYKNGAVTTITADRMHYNERIRREKRTMARHKYPLSISLSTSDTWPGTMRLWIQSTAHPHLWLNFELSKRDTAELGRRLADAAEWDIER